MPKVESSLYKGGILAISQSCKYNKINRGIRSKRDLTTNNNNTKIKRKIYKKLVRVQLLSNNTLNNDDVINVNVETTTKRRRRRIKIKKKKRKLNNSDQKTNEYLPQIVKSRKRIVVTKKRLINRTQYTSVESGEKTNTIPISSTIVNPDYNGIDYSDYDNDISKENHDEYDIDIDNDYDETTTQFQELVTLKESDFFHGNEDELYNEQDDLTTEPYLSEDRVVLHEEDENVSNNIDENIYTTTESDQIEITTEEVDKYVTSNANNLEETKNNISKSSIYAYNEEIADKPTFQDIPEYEPYFPELTESLDAPIILFKTTVLSSVDLLTKTVVQSRLRTYTFVVTTIAGDEQIITSTTEVRPHTKTTVITEPVTKLTTLTLLDIDATTTLSSPQQTISPVVLDNIRSLQDKKIQNFEEARNLATRIMSNGVEVIVAGDKTIPGEKDFKRFLTSGTYKPITLKPSTLTENVVMLIPQDTSKVNGLSTTMYPNQFITKTCLTTFTYLTTFLEGSTTTVSSHEQVVSNIATEERNTGKILPTPAMGVTVTQNPKLSVGVFHTTYTYLNTILDGDQPLVVSSKHTVTNTVTAPDDYLSLLKKVHSTESAMKDTNTYYSTIGLEKTSYEGNKTSVIRTNEVVTQVVITESVPPRATSVMTSYIALDKNNLDSAYITTDVVKTYLVTYTYYNTVQKDNSPVVYTNTSVSTDIVTEKLYLSPKTTSNYDIQSNNHQVNNFQIFTTKSYLTTFTYFTTLLQEENEATIVNSETSIVENVVSETIDLSLLDKSNLYQIKNAIEDGINTIVKTITLYNGETFEITAIANNPEDQINPTKVMPIEKTHMPDTLKMIKEDNNVPDKSTSNIITGSTIVFVDDDPFAQFNPTPVLKKTTDIKTSSQTIKSSKGVQKSKRSTKSKTKSQTPTIIPTKTKKNNVDSLKTKPQVDNKIKDIKPPKNDLLGLGSINIDSLQAIAPLLNSMAGFLTTNLKSNRRNDINITANTKKDNLDATKKVINKNSNQISENKDPVQMVDVQNRSPIYIPVRGLGDDFEIAESQNIASFDWVDPPPNKKTPEIHGSSLMTHGIPISPGEIITTNSDVIVGKPGRVGPRIPPIPLTNTIGENDITVELQPPPMHENIWHKKNHEYKRIPITNSFEKPHQYHHQEEYLKPPPPIQNSEYIIPIKGNEISRNVQNYVKNEKKYEPVRYQHQEQHASNNRLVHAYNINQEATFNKVIKNNVPERSNNHEYLPHNHHDIPFRLQEEILRGTKLNNINIKPSVINNEPIMLPEVIERSTGQPLLVNIQPSQIAFVNIPYNRTTALIYGGSTEPHKNGQYFNDPSPYPLQDYSIADGKDRPYISPSVYQPDLPNQKRVNGVIKVENQLIRHDSIGSNNQNIHIKPTKIGNFNVRENQEVSIPPVSFGVIHSGIDFDAHVINHENTFPNLIKKPYDDLSENQNDKNKFNIARKPVLTYPRPVYNQEGIVDNSIKLSSSIQDHKYQTPSKIYNNIPRPHQYGSKNQKTDISEIMLPPTTQKIQINNLFNQNSYKLPENFKPSYPILEVHLPPINNHQQIKAPHEYNNYDNHKVDDLENEDDEVIEESNTRPLRPGELPYEIVKLQATTTKRIPIFRETKPKFDENTSKITKLNYENKTLYENITAKQKLTTEKIFFPDFDRINLHGVGSHEIVSPYKPEKKPVLIFIDEKEESKHKFFNKDNGDNRDRPSVTSLPINTFKESYNHTTVTSRPINEFTENNRPKVTSLPIGKFNENVFQNNPTTTSKAINIFKKNRPEITSLPINVFKEYNSQYSTTSNPVSTYKQETRPTVYNPRPSVTSLPIDKVKLFNNRNRPPIISMASTNNKNRGTQTEKPFSGLPSKTISFNEIIKKEAIVPKNTIYKRPTRRPFTSKPTQTSIAVDHKTTVRPLTDMEILKPPPLIPEYFNNSTSTKPQEPVPKISVVMVPPPLQTDEDVFGMIPPPLTSLNSQQPITSTSKYSMEIDVSSNKTASTTTEVYKLLTLEHPTRKSNYKTSITTTKRRRPVYTGYTSTSTSNIIKQSPKTTPKTIISPTVTNKDVNVNINTNYSSSTTTISSSEQPSTSEENRNIIHSLDNSTTSLNEGTSIKFDVITSEIHNTGNDIKLESTTPLPSTIKTIYNETKSKITVPTRYITHTKTATVTITKTTVVKSLGMTPSTLTILVTETEKTTIIDTVTEVHTLVKPTNIIETVTTTIKQASSLYPYDIYGSQYPPIKVKPTISSPIFNNTVKEENSEENLEDFIIHETDPPITKDDNRNRIPAEENESILVVMTDKNTKNIVKVPSYETQERDEMITTNRDNNIFLSGILIDHQEDKKEEVLEGCEIECKASRNELCQKINGVSRCTCRPGFARMFPDRPCLPTYTYDVQVTLGRIGKDHLHFYDDLKDPNSTEHYKFVQATNEALDRMVMQSDLRDISHGIKVHAFEPADEGIVSKFYLQLSENVEQNRLEDIFKKYLLNNSLSLGGTDIFASPRIELEANDFNECSNTNFHDCSENAHCFNLKGTYSCSCKEGYSDLSENMLYPGRICSADQVGCETCNYHGTCYTVGAEDTFCDCFQWYTGQYCHINLKVILIALVTLGTLLLGLLLTCIILTCVRGRHVEVPGGINFLPQGNSGRRNTLDRRAMIQDTSSEEDNKSDTSRYVKKQKAAPQRKISKVSLKVAERIEPATTNHNITSAEQKDRSLTVMIPRAKYHPAPPTSPLSNYTSFDVRKPSVPSITNEAKLLSLLDAGPSPNQSERIQQFNNVPSELLSEDKTNSRKTSGALISAGFEVSATVVNNMGTLGTTCGTEADRSENATLIQKISADLLSSTGTRSQFNTLRQSLIDEDVKSEGNMDTGSTWLPRVMTISETLSYDETTTPTPMKRLQTDFDSKPSSQHPNDEANTMAERDLGSTFLLPHTHLYKAERGSDISGFESL